jgi:hypothetical protein
LRCNNDHDYSPDGKLIAISASSPASRQSQIYVSNADGSGHRLIVSAAPSYFHGWSPDGKYLTYVANRDGKQYDVYRVPAGGGTEERLTFDPAYDDGPDYSPDGTWIYFNSDRGGGWNIWRIPAAGAGANDQDAQRITSDALEDWFPHPSPDGKAILFLSFPHGTEGHNDRELRVHLRWMPAPDAAGRGAAPTTLAEVTGGQGTINVNSWSPDSKRFAYVAYEPLPLASDAAVASGFSLTGPGWQANPDLVRQLSQKQPQFNYEESRVTSYTLPDPLESSRGRVRAKEQWGARRAEILDLFREHVYGRSPGKPQRVRFETIEENTRAMDGRATLRRVAIISSHAGRDHRFELTLFLPNARPDRVPVFLLMNNRPVTNTEATRMQPSGFWPAEDMIARGYGMAAIQNNELAPDDKLRFRDGVIQFVEPTTAGPRAGDAWAALAAWGWGASRAMDYFASDPRIDAGKVAVLGHSRGGKAALWAGAEDERFALVISNESGEGGAALTRRNYGETLARITDSFPHWFAENYRTFAQRIDSLPVDQHMLLALIAPRALYVASADEDLWADPRGEFLSQVHASPVYALFGEPEIRPDQMPPLNQPLVAGRRGYHVRNGSHNLTPYDWARFADFADRLWKK